MKTKFALLGLLLLGSTSVNALDFGVGVKAGTVGTGAEISVALTETINARVALTDVSTDFDEDIEVSDAENQYTIDSNLDLDFGAQAILFDWYVFNGTFHVTAGVMKNDSTIDLSGTLIPDGSGNVLLGGTSYNVATDFVDPSITGKISAGEDFEPYLGIGIGRKAGNGAGLSFSAEIGVMLMDPSVDLNAPTATNPANQAQLDTDVDEAEASANDEISDLEMYPILSVGLNYAF
ncbi:MAG: hypothetical protein QNJ56_12410 [Gammaproteobacteria bacterium]|nr:hypothetical protein [Gammaproteobacteria bacterium]